MRRTVRAFNRFDDTTNSTEISWSETLRNRARKGLPLAFDQSALRIAAYRPFHRQHLYFDDALNHRRGVVPRLFPTRSLGTLGFQVTGVGSSKGFAALMVDQIPDLAFWGSGSSQFFPRYQYEKVEDDDMLTLEGGNGEVVDGYRRIDNMTDEALARFRAAYGDDVTKDDIFFYCYGLLHSPDYRETYAADLKKWLPRIPLVVDPWPFVDAGRRLSELHLGYESVTPYPLDGLAGVPQMVGMRIGVLLSDGAG